ncbi:MAG: alanine dehydrogenase, partial [Ruminococcus sp.]|nr:alanine dehydrogenase [Ruminococcus sp.]
MKIGCVKEIKNNEFRVGLTPDNVASYVAAGHEVYIEKSAGVGSGFADDEYVSAGATMIDNAADVWSSVDMMVKVKEPLEEEYGFFREGLILYTYLHLAADEKQMDALLDGKVKAVAYETLQETDHSLPLLAPMSQIAGRLSIQEGAKYLEKRFGGEGILLAGVPGTPKANVVILGGGTVGMNACKIAVGMGANVTILDINLKRLEELD